MYAIEIEAPIVNHRMVIDSLRLPAHVGSAKVIVMYEAEAEPTSPSRGALADFRQHPLLVNEPLVFLSREEANER
jgi:hypothetical protein